jgi:hypothetical protein
MVATKSSQIWKDMSSSRIYEKYGGFHFTQTSAYKENARNRIFLKYGVYSIMHVPEICEKILKSAYKIKEYVLPSGKIVPIQGYENHVIDFLLTEHSEEDIVISFDIPFEFFYFLDGAEHRYYPDIFLKSKNKIIEVKSTYTVTQNIQKNIEKQHSVLNEGIGYEVWVVDGDGAILEKITDYKSYIGKVNQNA